MIYAIDVVLPLGNREWLPLNPEPGPYWTPRLHTDLLGEQQIYEYEMGVPSRIAYDRIEA